MGTLKSNDDHYAILSAVYVVEGSFRIFRETINDDVVRRNVNSKVLRIASLAVGKRDLANVMRRNLLPYRPINTISRVLLVSLSKIDRKSVLEAYEKVTRFFVKSNWKCNGATSEISRVSRIYCCRDSTYASFDTDSIENDCEFSMISCSSISRLTFTDL